MDPEKLKLSTTTDGKPPREGYEDKGAPAPIGRDGMHEAYWILSAEERAKGFIRPVRRTYVHCGRSVCGKHEPPTADQNEIVICTRLPGHEGDCSLTSILTPAQLDRVKRTGMLGGCDSTTTMGIAIAETYARDPKYYGSTFCCHCQKHFRVGEYGEFVWDDAPNERVGT